MSVFTQDFAKCPAWSQLQRAERNADRALAVAFMLMLALVCAIVGD